ncbi:hypothetical protein [Sagittula sp. SSi028]|uniref:hypothetical protein n=1 Tax=Sagittula sp. SSi028 TaxID=3400636 RepID=UPI003AF6E450
MTDLQNMLDLSADDLDTLHDCRPPEAPLAMPVQSLTGDDGEGHSILSWVRGFWLRPSA